MMAKFNARSIEVLRRAVRYLIAIERVKLKSKQHNRSLDRPSHKYNSHDNRYGADQPR